MFLEKLFCNTFGLIWLVVVMVVVLGLIVFLFIKKEKVVEENIEFQEADVKHVEEISNNKEEEEKTVEGETLIEEKDEVKVASEYEVLESEDGFFRVRKFGSDRTLRKFSTKEEAVEFVKQKESK